MKNVIAKIKAIQTDTDGNSQSIEFESQSKLYKKGNTYYISYIESENPGIDGSKTTIKVCGNIVNIIRFGSIGSNLKFQEKMEHNCQYKTPYGIIPMTILSNTVEVSIGEDSGRIFLDYDIYIEGNLSTRNKFSLNY